MSHSNLRLLSAPHSTYIKPTTITNGLFIPSNGNLSNNDMMRFNYMNSPPPQERENIDHFAKTLKASNDIINLYIGHDHDNCYRVQSAILTSASQEHKTRIQKFKTDYPGSPVTLHFPNDDIAAWELLLFWLFKSTFPPRHELSDITLLRAWTLGSTLWVKAAFPDLCMLELLRQCDIIELPEIHNAFVSAREHSPMRRFLAEHIIFVLNSGLRDSRLDIDDLVEFGQIRGAMPAVLKAQKEYGVLGMDMTERFGRGGHRPTVWQEFMIADGPQAHWLYDVKIQWIREQGEAGAARDWDWD